MLRTQEGIQRKPGRQLSPEPDSDGILLMDFPSSRTVGNKSVLSASLSMISSYSSPKTAEKRIILFKWASGQHVNTLLMNLISQILKCIKILTLYKGLGFVHYANTKFTRACIPLVMNWHQSIWWNKMYWALKLCWLSSKICRSQSRRERM